MTSAAADVEIAAVALVLAPVLRARGVDRIEWDGVPGQTYTVESRTQSDPWIVQARIHSATPAFSYTHLAPISLPQFLRVSHP